MIKMPEFKRKPIEGLLALMPLCLKENQEIDYDGIRTNIDLLEEKGAHGFVQFGCMGQMNAPSETEYNEVCNVAVKAAKGKKLAAVVSSTATSTQEVIRRARYAENAGADGSMLAVPYAFPLTAEWAAQFYKDVDQALKGELAIMAYNYPPLTELNMNPGLWRNHLLNIKSIKALKESNAVLSHYDEMLITVADKINFCASPENTFYHASALGAKGIIGYICWVALKVTRKWLDECMAKKHQDPWVKKVFQTFVLARGAMNRPDMPPLGTYEHSYLNTFVEIGGGKGGPPRKPYGELPEKAKELLKEILRPLVDMEKGMEKKWV
jgi:4-hydroxy-tetrahydrodipicolinate synthase